MFKNIENGMCDFDYKGIKFKMNYDMNEILNILNKFNNEEFCIHLGNCWDDSPSYVFVSDISYTNVIKRNYDGNNDEIYQFDFDSYEFINDFIKDIEENIKKFIEEDESYERCGGTWAQINLMKVTNAICKIKGKRNKFKLKDIKELEDEYYELDEEDSYDFYFDESDNYCFYDD